LHYNNCSQRLQAIKQQFIMETNVLDSAENNGYSLIRIDNNNGQQAVSARELHTFLGSKQDFSTWIKNRIEKYGFIENQDFEVLHKFMEQVSGGKHLIEYVLSLDCAKEIAMVEGNEKGKQARRYFIECEKRLKSIAPAVDFSNPDTVLMLVENWKAEKERADYLEKQNVKLDLKTQYIDTIIESNSNVTMSQAAKLLKLPFGRNTMAKQLREFGVFFTNSNEPKQSYIDRGYFLIFTFKNEKMTKPSNQTFITQKGLVWLAKKFNVIIPRKSVSRIQ